MPRKPRRLVQSAHRTGSGTPPGSTTRPAGGSARLASRQIFARMILPVRVRPGCARRGGRRPTDSRRPTGAVLQLQHSVWAASAAGRREGLRSRSRSGLQLKATQLMEGRSFPSSCSTAGEKRTTSRPQPALVASQQPAQMSLGRCMGRSGKEPGLPWWPQGGLRSVYSGCKPSCSSMLPCLYPPPLQHSAYLCS